MTHFISLKFVTKMSKTPQTFEDAMMRLEKLTQQIQNTDTPLEEALKNYEEGRKLVQFCRQKLAEVEQKLHILDNNQLTSMDLDNLTPTPEKVKSPRKTAKPDMATDELWGDE